MKIICQFVKLPQTSIVLPEIYPTAFRVFSLLLSKFVHCFARNSGKSNGKFGQKQWENLGKSNEKTRKAAAYISGKNYCFCPNFPLLFPEFPIAFARISHCFCPNFSFFFFFWDPPPPTPMCVCILFECRTVGQNATKVRQKSFSQLLNFDIVLQVY